MEFILAYWWVWLIGMLVCGWWGMWKWKSSVMNAGNDMLSAFSNNKPGEDLFESMKKVRQPSVGPAIFAVVLANIFGVLLILSVVVALIDYIKG